ncbi:glycosyltransferase family 4 protein [Aureitalea marina]|uniref:glycosyltransferase family 4 protein n=1 Tax=Aureitalea marina TaxID=930804 RepID=UPI0015E39806|nr:glycosyltransferase family 4 protein [Aureitalea marina]
MRLARSYGNVLVYDTDDLTIIEAKQKDHVMHLCDAITVSTEFLKKEFAKHFEPVIVIRNALSSAYWQAATAIRESKYEGDNKYVTMAYLSGSATHDDDFKIIEQSLLELLNQYDQTRLILAGKLNFSKDFFQFQDRFINYEFMSYTDYVNLYKCIDINLAPLDVDKPFNQGRSELKYMEAGACGIPTVASPTDSYLHAIEPGVNGLLASGGEWKSQLIKLINNSELRRELGVKACADMSANYLGDSRVREYIDLIHRLKDQQNVRSGPLRRLACLTSVYLTRLIR